jgi:signal transduction histidine kinase
MSTFLNFLANEALLEAREKLMLTITHDIKAPLGSIMGYIDLLTRLDLGKRGALYLDHMKSSASSPTPRRRSTSGRAQCSHK